MIDPGERARVVNGLDRMTIDETTLPRRATVLGYVLGYAIGGLRALGVPDVAIRYACEQAIVAHHFDDRRDS